MIHPLFRRRTASLLALLALTAAVPTTMTHAAGDLLVAPTRILLDGPRGTEVFLNNIGSETATYRISLELRRMTPDGDLDEVTDAEANAIELAAKEMIRYAPRRVVLPPNQPQAIRIQVRPPEGLADGEYRAHMLFRAIPEPKPAEASPAEPATGLTFSITPIYGVTIPIIVRQGQLSSTAALANARIVRGEQGTAFAFDLSHQGNRSTYGDIFVRKAGVAEPLLVAKGIAIYPELQQRTVSLGIPPELAAQLSGQISVEFREPDANGGGLIAKIDQLLR